MTTSKSNAVSLSAKEWVSGDGDLMKALMKEALQEVLEAEMSEFLGAAPSERSETRSGYRAGYYHRGLVTRIGKLELRVPRDRSGEFSTALFERYARSEKALVAALASTLAVLSKCPCRLPVKATLALAVPQRCSDA